MGIGLAPGALGQGGGPTDEVSPGLTETALVEVVREVRRAWVASLPATFSSVTTTATLTAQKYAFAIGTAVETGALPPVQHPWLGRQGSGPDDFLTREAFP